MNFATMIDVVMVSAVSFALPLEAATVKGIVLNSSGTHVSHALVAVLNPYEPFNGIPKYIKTDESGAFSWDGLSPGFYMVFASKEQENYGNTQVTLFGDGVNPPELSIKKIDDIVDVTVNIGRPGGVVQGRIIDKDTNKALTQVSLKVILEKQKEKFMSFAPALNGTFEVLIPSRTVLISAKRAGYRESILAITLSPDENKQLTIMLTRINASKGEK